jgi:hypothetical protein
MSTCSQSKGQTILQHGEAVASKYKDLIAGRTEGWRLPDWFDLDYLLPLCPPSDIMEQYHIFHDCGKPYCVTMDEDGRQHFPDHARISAAMWRVHGGDEQIAELIARDMDMHTLKAAEAATYDRMDLAPALLLTALSELHANAEMFGGIESTSFKIKFKAINKLGRNIITQLKGN